VVLNKTNKHLFIKLSSDLYFGNMYLGTSLRLQKKLFIKYGIINVIKATRFRNNLYQVRSSLESQITEKFLGSGIPKGLPIIAN
jgi:hypothetical protein